MNWKGYGRRRLLHNLRYCRVWKDWRQPSGKLSVPTYEPWTSRIRNRSATYLIAATRQNTCLLYISLPTSCNPRWAGWRSQYSDYAIGRRNPRRGTGFFSTLKRPDRLWGPPSLSSIGIGGVFPEGKAVPTAHFHTAPRWRMNGAVLKWRILIWRSGAQFDIASFR